MIPPLLFRFYGNRFHTRVLTPLEDTTPDTPDRRPDSKKIFPSYFPNIQKSHTFWLKPG